MMVYVGTLDLAVSTWKLFLISSVLGGGKSKTISIVAAALCTSELVTNVDFASFEVCKQV